MCGIYHKSHGFLRAVSKHLRCLLRVWMFARRSAIVHMCSLPYTPCIYMFCPLANTHPEKEPAKKGTRPYAAVHTLEMTVDYWSLSPAQAGRLQKSIIPAVSKLCSSANNAPASFRSLATALLLGPGIS